VRFVFIKPENVLFKSETSRYGHLVTLKIADFGLSRSINLSRSRRDTASGGVGTDCWMPPEGLQGRCGDTASLTFSYDVHPAGSLLYYVLCAGVHAFPGRNDVERNISILQVG
jgi:serine/threonine protein kinase